jgi:hypothetical protein
LKILPDKAKVVDSDPDIAWNIANTNSQNEFVLALNCPSFSNLMKNHCFFIYHEGREHHEEKYKLLMLRGD